jgi:hypothetical protein
VKGESKQHGETEGEVEATGGRTGGRSAGEEGMRAWGRMEDAGMGD